MRNKNGFFSMSLIYSFFLVFALISALLLANYAHNRLLSKNYNDEIKINLDDRGERKLINLYNKLENSSFEQNTSGENNWVLTNSLIVNNQKFHDSKSLFFLINSNNSIAQELKNNVIKQGHKYYFQYAYFTANLPVSYTSFKISIHNSGNSKIYYFQNLSNSNINTSNWTIDGYIITVDEDINENEKWYLEIAKTGNSVNPLYLDAFILTDLSQSYGYGEEASLSWLNSNIEYFEKSYIHQRKDYVQ